MSGPVAYSATVHMFAEDVLLGIVPHGREVGGDSGVVVDIRGDVEQREAAIGVLAELGEYPETEPWDVVVQAVEEIAGDLVYRGVSVWETCRRGGNEGTGWTLRPTSANRWGRTVRGRVKGMVRGAVDRWFGRSVFDSGSDVWAVGMPRELGGRRGYRRMLHRLGRFDAPWPRFTGEELRAGRLLGALDVERYAMEVRCYSGILTKRWGMARSGLE